MIMQEIGGFEQRRAGRIAPPAPQTPAPRAQPLVSPRANPKSNLLSVVAALLFSGSLLAAGQPGEKAKGPATKSEGFSLVWGKLKATSDVDFGDERKSKYSLALEGSVEVPAALDVVAVSKQFQIAMMTDSAGKPVALKPVSTWGLRNNAIHHGVGQVELPRIELPIDATKIRAVKFTTEVVIAEERVTAELPAVVMEDFKNVGNDISIRITNLRMSTGRELTVNLNFKRSDTGVGSAFIEKIFALDADRKELGGGRWTEGDPLGKTGTWTAKFKLSGDQRHQSFRFDIVTKSKSRKLAFEVKDIFTR